MKSILSIGLCTILLTGCFEKQNKIKEVDSINQKIDFNILERPKDVINNNYIDLTSKNLLSVILKNLEQIDGKKYILHKESLNFDIEPSSVNTINSFEKLKNYIYTTSNGLYDIEITNPYTGEDYYLVLGFDKYERNKEGLERKKFNFNIDKNLTIKNVFDLITEYTKFNIIPMDDDISNQINDIITSFNFKGDNIKELLNYLSDMYNFYYEVDYKNKNIKVFKYKFETFMINVIDRQTTYEITTGMSFSGSEDDSSSSSSSSEESSMNGSGVKISEKGKIENQEYLKESLNEIFGVVKENNTNTTTSETTTSETTINNVIENIIKDKSYYKLDKNLGLINVFATPKKMKQAKKVINEYEEMMNKSVYTKINIYKISLSKDNQYGIDWNLFTTNVPDIKNKLTGSAPIITNETKELSMLNGFKYNNTNKTFNFDMFVKSVNQFGDLELVDTFEYVVANNELKYDSKIKKRDYFKRLKNIETVSTLETVGSETSKEPELGVIEEGTFLYIQPRIIGKKVRINANMFFNMLLEEPKKEIYDNEKGDFVNTIKLSKENKKIDYLLNDGDKVFVTGFIKEKKDNIYSGVLPFQEKIIQSVSGMNTDVKQREEYFITLEVKIK